MTKVDGCYLLINFCLLKQYASNLIIYIFRCSSLLKRNLTRQSHADTEECADTVDIGDVTGELARQNNEKKYNF